MISGMSMFSFMRMCFPRIRSSYTSLVYAGILALLILGSCRSDKEKLTLRPDGAQIEGLVNDTMALVAYSIAEDSVKTDSLRSNILGAMNDPEFGKSEASLATQIQLPEINIDFDGALAPDSVVLSIAFVQNSLTYGNPASSQTISVRRIEEDLKPGIQYYSNYQFQTGNMIGQWTGVFNTEDSVHYDRNGVEIKDVPQIRIRLDQAFGQEFLDADPTIYTGQGAFLDFMKGLYLTADASGMSSGEGMIAEMDLSSTASNMTIYYSDSLSKVFPISPESERINTYSHSDVPAAITNQLADPGVNYEELYIQSMAGTKLKIDLPNIYELVKDGRVAINEAVITLPVKSGTSSEEYDAPVRLLLLQPSATNGSNTFILDLIDQIAPPNSNWIGYSNYGGVYNAGDEVYKFHFTRYLQQLLDDYVINGEDNNRGFYVIIPSDNPITPSRVIIDNESGGSGRSIDLKITYTKL